METLSYIPFDESTKFFVPEGHFTTYYQFDVAIRTLSDKEIYLPVVVHPTNAKMYYVKRMALLPVICCHPLCIDDEFVIKAGYTYINTERLYQRKVFRSHMAYFGMLPSVTEARKGQRFVTPLHCQVMPSRSPTKRPVYKAGLEPTPLHFPYLDSLSDDTWAGLIDMEPQVHKWSDIMQAAEEGRIELVEDIPERYRKLKHTYVPKGYLRSYAKAKRGVNRI